MPVTCPKCDTPNRDSAKFCKRCAVDLRAKPEAPAPPPPPPPVRPPEPVPAIAVSPRADLPPQRIERPVRKTSGVTPSTLPLGNKVAAIGGLVALAGCFIPLAAGEPSSTIIPSMVKETAYGLIPPLSAVALAVMAWSAASGPARSRVMLGGSIIALGSPWAVACILAILAATRAISALGQWGLGVGQLGVGTFALAAGFVAAVVGGFIILRDNVSD